MPAPGATTPIVAVKVTDWPYTDDGVWSETTAVVVSALFAVTWIVFGVPLTVKPEVVVVAVALIVLAELSTVVGA